jgi:hypothetical protein
MLYASAGDNENGNNTHDLGTTHGKILRMRPDGTPPTDNPWYGVTTGKYRTIWAEGFRNPFTFAIDPASGLLYVNDVGENSYEEVNRVVAGGDYGWPQYEGPFTPPPGSGLTSPLHSYDHGHGCAITGGVLYAPAQPALPSLAGRYVYADFCADEVRSIDPAAPASYTLLVHTLTSGAVDLDVGPDGALYYLARGDGDDTNPTGVVVRVGQGTVLAPPAIVTQPAGQSVGAGRTASFSVVATGASPLAYQWQRNGTSITGATTATYVTPPVAVSDDGAAFRCVVSNSVGSATSAAATLRVLAPPAITTQPAGQSVSPGRTASFSVVATGATPLAYQWQRSGTPIPGATLATYVTPAVTSSDDGASFRCVVSNGVGSATSDAATLRVLANMPPIVAILTPAASATYAAGDTIRFSGSASDPEDGVLAASALTWRVDFHRGFDVIPVLPPTSGLTQGAFVVPDHGEPSTDVGYRLSLQARDALGGTTSVVREVRPRLSSLSLGSDPPGLRVSVDGLPAASPLTVPTVVGMRRQVGAPSPQVQGGAVYRFQGWSDHGDSTHEVAAADQPLALVASFASPRDTIPAPPTAVTVTALEPARPNPIGAQGTIDFTLASDGAVTIQVLDVDGRVRDEPASGTFTAGRHALPWSASSLTPGVYWISMRAGGRTAWRKVVVAR